MHDLNSSYPFCRQIPVIENGEIIAAGGMEVMTPQNIESVDSTPVYLRILRVSLVVVPV